jgi:hypothetical protein
MAIYPNDATGSFTTATFTDMRDRKPDRGYGYDRAYDVITFESDAGYEKRRLRSRRPKRLYNLSYTNITGLELEAIESFYDARSGSFESFTLDLEHLNTTGNVTVRFEGPLSVSHNYSSDANALLNFYTINFRLQETFD